MLGCGIVGCEWRHRLIVRIGFSGHVDQFGDAEVEQLHPSTFVDKDIVWLEVTMDDKISMGECDRVAYLKEQTQACLKRRGILCTVDRYRPPFDELHDRVGSSVRGTAAIQQTRNSGVIKAGKDLALGVEAVELSGRFMAEQLERAALDEFGFRARGQIHLAHAAATDQAFDLPGTDAHSGRQ